MRATVLVMFVATALGACGSSRDRARGPDAGTVMCGERGSVLSGESCVCDEECAGATGTLCADEATTGAPGGHCVVACSSDEDCAEGRSCYIPAGESLGLCSIDCVVHTDCPDGNVCFLDDCYPYCSSDAQCRSGLCDPYSRTCNQGADPPGAGLYESCVRDEDCRSRSCDATKGRCNTLCLVSEQDCPDGAVCVGIFFEEDVGVCHPRCTDGTCPDAELECRDAGMPAGEMVCMEPGDATGCLGRVEGATDGMRCGCDDDCETGTICAEEVDTGIAGGLCLRRCETSADCPGESTVCNGVYCTASCSGDADCGPGPRICDAGMCEPFCTTDADCRTGTCNPYWGRCEPVPTEGLPNGGVCASDAECRSDLCFDSTRPQGVCGGPCRVSAQTCPDGGVCVGEGTDDSGICYPPCTTTDDCGAEGWVCTPTTFPADAPDHCE